MRGGGGLAGALCFVSVVAQAQVAASAAPDRRHARGVDLGGAPGVGDAGEQLDGLSFLVMGDWGGRPGDGCVPAGQPDPSGRTCGNPGPGTHGPTPWTSHAQVATAAGMSQEAEKLGSKFALALGDNFYFDGISMDASSNNRSDALSARFNDTFEDVFTAPSLQADAGFAFYVVGGESPAVSPSGRGAARPRILRRSLRAHSCTACCRQPRSLRQYLRAGRLLGA